MKILGMNQDGHNSSLALVEDGKILFAAVEERFNREKHTTKFPFGALKHVLKDHPWDTIDHVALGWNSMANAASRRRGFMDRRWKPESLYQVPMKLEMVLGLVHPEWTHSLLNYGDAGKVSVYFLDHHLCHAASVVYPSGFTDCAFLSVDALGERHSVCIGMFDDGRLKVLQKTDFPMSPGIVYGSVTEYLGFRFNEDEWKVMALGTTRPPTLRAAEYAEEFAKILSMNPDGTVRVDLKYFEYGLDRVNVFSKYMESKFGPARKKNPDAPIEDHHIDVAYGVQKAFEHLMVDLARWTARQTGKKYLALAGGCVMNCVANALVEQSGFFSDVYIGGWPSDEGTALGAPFYLATQILGEKWVPSRVEHSSFGRSFSDASIKELLVRLGVKHSQMEAAVLQDAVTDRLMDGEVIGLFEGMEEFGPRALGHRSILADPGRPDMKARVNAKIKYREAFRPFAPSVLIEEAAKWFQLGKIVEAPFMEKTVSVWPDKAKQIPAVLHFDNTARIQTVARESHPFYYDLIQRFFGKTGVPMVLNTSFNLAGEPIVSSPEDALRTFITSGLDALVLGSFLITK